MCPKDVKDLSILEDAPGVPRGYLEIALGGPRDSIFIPMSRPKGVLDALEGTMGSQEPSLGSQMDAFGSPTEGSGRPKESFDASF